MEQKQRCKQHRNVKGSMSSYGQQLLREYINAMIDQEFVEDYRPDWMQGLELDFYFFGIRVAFEFQGDQHYVPAFGEQPWRNQQQRDEEKKALCKRLGVHLVCIDAVNLGYFEIYYQLKILKLRHVKVKQKKWDIVLLKELNRKSKEYRATLDANYRSPTVFRKKTENRHCALVEWGVAKPKLFRRKKPKHYRNPERIVPIEDPPHLEGNVVVLTQELLDKCKTEKGGFTKATVKVFGGEWGIRRAGWTQELIGRTIPKEQYLAAFEGKAHFISKP